MKTARAKIASERPQLRTEWYSKAPIGELQTPHDVLVHIGTACGDPHDWKLAIDTFLSLTEALLEQYSPPFRGGYEWDNRRKPREEEWR